MSLSRLLSTNIDISFVPYRIYIVTIYHFANCRYWIDDSFSSWLHVRVEHSHLIINSLNNNRIDASVDINNCAIRNSILILMRNERPFRKSIYEIPMPSPIPSTISLYRNDWLRRLIAPHTSASLAHAIHRLSFRNLISSINMCAIFFCYYQTGLSLTYACLTFDIYCF